MFSPRLSVWLMAACWLVRTAVAFDIYKPKEGKIADLPAGISPAEGQVSLIADYAHATDDAI